MIALGADHMRFKPQVKEDHLGKPRISLHHLNFLHYLLLLTLILFFTHCKAYYAVRIFIQLVYGKCISEENVCNFELTQDQVDDFNRKVVTFEGDLISIRPPGSNTHGHGAPGH